MSLNKAYRSYLAEAAIGAYLIVKPGASGGVVAAAAATDALIGTTDSLPKVAGEMADVVTSNLGEVLLGAAVVAGAPLTANASGAAITAAPAAGANVRVIGFAEVAGAAGDVITYYRAPGVMQG